MWRKCATVQYCCYVLLLSAGFVSAVLYLQVALGRIAYPYQIEWIESGIFQQVIRITQGVPLYGDPSMEFVPALYMPLFHYVSALVASVVGHSLFALRLVSFASSLMTCVALAYAVKKHAGSWFYGLMAAGFYLSTYQYTGFWFDIGRVDSLWVMWLAWSVAILMPSSGSHTAGNLLLSAIFFSLAFFTKQSSLFVLPFFVMAVYCWYSLKGALFFVRSLVFIVLPSFVFMQVMTGGKFLFYTMQMAGSHDFNWHRIDVFLLDNSLYSVPMLILLSVFFVWRSGEWAWFWLLSGFAGMSAISRMYAGGVYNVLMPYYMLLSLLAALGFFGFAAWMGEKRRMTWLVCVSVMAALNIVRGWYRPSAQIPGDAARAFGDQLVMKIAEVPGRVCLTKDGYLAYLAGKDFCAHNALMADLMHGGDRQLSELLAKDVRHKVSTGYYEVIVINSPVELTDFGFQLQDIPYTAYVLPYDRTRFTGQEFFPVAGGPAPGSWLVFNGQHWRDERQ